MEKFVIWPQLPSNGDYHGNKRSRNRRYFSEAFGIQVSRVLVTAATKKLAKIAATILERLISFWMTLVIGLSLLLYFGQAVWKSFLKNFKINQKIFMRRYPASYLQQCTKK